MTRTVPSEYGTIQAAIDASAHRDTILVSPGTYVENINYNGKNIAVASLYLTTGDTSYISATIIDGNASGSVVTFESGEDNNAVLTGFTVQNGYIWGNGGGVSCSQADPTISKNIITGNSVEYYGGGISCYYSDAIIAGNIITGNTTDRISGGGSGGVYCSHSSIVLINNTISDNISNYSCGGLRLDDCPSVTISDNTIVDNTASHLGGGILSINAPDVQFTGNTISGNHTDDEGGGLYLYNSSFTVVNTILWGNSADLGEDEIFLEGTGNTLDITYSDIRGGWAGTGNIDCDPLFCDSDNDDYSLFELSCCLGAGEGGVDIGAIQGFGCSADTLDVPSEYATIQAAIDASSNYDIVLVQPGTYVENINYNGKNIIVGSLYLTTGDTSYITSTIIDGNASGSVVTFNFGEGSYTTLTGFTVQNGASSSYSAGIYCSSSDPLISHNIVFTTA